MNDVPYKRAMSRRNRWRELRDFVLYVLVGVGMVTLAMLLGSSGLDARILFKWVGFAVTTALVFGDAISNRRSWWPHPRFWVLLVAFLVAQCAVGIIILSRVTSLPAIYWAFLIPLDGVLLGVFLAFFLELRRN